MENTGDKEFLKENAAYLVNPPKGILAADESKKSCCKRFEELDFECTDESRRAFREMIIAAPGLGELLSGMILTDETIRQSTAGGVPFVDVLIENGIKPGIKVDEGIIGYKSEDDIEFVTKGVEGLPPRMLEYKNMGAAFAKWRAVFSVTHGLPTAEALAENVKRMGEYALICQANNIVPIVEPEVLIDGNHSIHDTEETMRKVIGALMNGLRDAGVYFPGLILKTSMVVSGKKAEHRAGAEEVATRTIAMLKDCVPANIGGVVYLSGGQSHKEANANFDAIMRHSAELPFPMAFSFSRAFQNESLAHYVKDSSDVAGAQKILIENIKDIAAL